MNAFLSMASTLLEDPRFQKAIALFNSRDWYSAHDVFEELWHETYGLERNTIHCFLQIAVAQVHLESGNTNGATILFGEALGRLSKFKPPDLGFDLEKLCESLKLRLHLLHHENDPGASTVPFLLKRT